MRSQPEAELPANTLTVPMRSLVVGSDHVACVLAARLIERLGHPAPRQAASVEDAAALPEAFDLVLVDDGAIPIDLPPASWLLHIGQAAQLIVMCGAGLHLSGIPAQTVLRKPLTLAALAAALAGMPHSRGSDDFDDALWSELLRLFGRNGVTEMVAALGLDLLRQQREFELVQQRHDARALRGIAHSLRGAAQQLGAGRLASLCTEVELRAATGMSAETATSGARMLSRYGALVARLQRELEQA